MLRRILTEIITKPPIKTTDEFRDQLSHHVVVLIEQQKSLNDLIFELSNIAAKYNPEMPIAGIYQLDDAIKQTLFAAVARKLQQLQQVEPNEKTQQAIRDFNQVLTQSATSWAGELVIQMPTGPKSERTSPLTPFAASQGALSAKYDESTQSIKPSPDAGFFKPIKKRPSGAEKKRKKKGKEAQQSLMAAATASDPRLMQEYLKTGDPQAAFTLSAQNGNLEVVTWFLENSGHTFNPETIRTAVDLILEGDQHNSKMEKVLLYLAPLGWGPKNPDDLISFLYNECLDYNYFKFADYLIKTYRPFINFETIFDDESGDQVRHFTLLLKALKDNQHDFANLFIENGADINFRTDNRGPPLITAIFFCESMVKVLLEKGADANCTDPQGYTPLHCATDELKLDSVKALLQHDALVCVSKNGQEVNILEHAKLVLPQLESDVDRKTMLKIIGFLETAYEKQKKASPEAGAPFAP